MPTTTWNPAAKSADLTLSNGDLTVTKTSGDATWDSVRGTNYHFGGRWYFEVTLNAVNTVSGGACIGVGTTAMDLNNYPGAGTNGNSMHMHNGLYNYNTGTTFQTYGLYAAGLPAQAGETIGVEVSGQDFNMRFTNLSTQDTEGDGPYWTSWLTFSTSLIAYIGYYPVVSLYKLNEQATANFGASPFVIDRIPVGATSWDGSQSWTDWAITTEDFAELLEPPKPPMPNVRLTNPDGTPTKAYHDFLTKRYEYDRAVRTLLQEG